MRTHKYKLTYSYTCSVTSIHSDCRLHWSNRLNWNEHSRKVEAKLWIKPQFQHTLNIQLEFQPKAVKMHILAYIVFLPTRGQILLVLRTGSLVLAYSNNNSRKKSRNLSHRHNEYMQISDCISCIHYNLSSLTSYKQSQLTSQKWQRSKN
jgi:hypothetical protein